jgi:hypothetical protein
MSFSTCKDQYNNLHYFMAERELGDYGVCVLHEIEAFPRLDKMAVGDSPTVANEDVHEVFWKHPPAPWRIKPSMGQRGEGTRADGKYFPSEPQIEMADAGSKCPPADATVFVSVNGVSPLEFKRVTLYWRTLLSSRSDFEFATSRIDDETKCEGHSVSSMKETAARVGGKIFVSREPMRLSFVGRFDGKLTALLEDVTTGEQFTSTLSDDRSAFKLRCLFPTPIP